MNTLLGGFLSSLSILGTWLVLAALLAGVGLGIRRAFGLRGLRSDDVIAGFWMGFAATCFFLQIWHFWRPINAAAFGVMVGAGLVSMVWVRKDIAGWLGEIPWRSRMGELLVLGLAALWVANHAMNSPNAMNDTGLYHWPVMKWAASYPIVPGIANLHHRLGYQNVHLLFAAMFNVGPWAGRVFHIVNGLIIGVALIQMLWSGFRMLRAPAGGRARFAADLVLLAPVVALVGSPHVSSLTTDSVSAVILYVLVSRLFAALIDSSANTRATAYELGALATLCVLAVASKLSAVGFAGPAWLLVAWVAVRRLSGQPSLRRRTLAWMAGTALFFGGVYATRGVIQSGHPAFPSNAASFSVDWSTPAEMGEADRGLIRYRARHFYDRPSVPGSATDDTPLNAPWVLGWIRNIAVMPMVLEPGLLILVAILALVSRRRRNTEKSEASLVFLPLVVGLAFWFWSAPNPRFGQFLFWIAAATMVGEAFRRSAEHLARKQLVIGVLGTLALILFALASS
ncbi:MAG: hypothetical protein ABI836_01470, partial [Gemmatimonadota bacterium]